MLDFIKFCIKDSFFEILLNFKEKIHFYILKSAEFKRCILILNGDSSHTSLAALCSN